VALHVVVGAGAVGMATARLLAARGDQVRLVSRRGTGPEHPSVERIGADATDSAALARIAHGAVAVYNCAAPPYHRWTLDWPLLADALLDAAEATGAVLVSAGNLYLYGPVDGPMTEDLPLAAPGPKGRVRASMWADALAAHRAGRVRVTEVRGSDYLGARGQSQLGDRVVPRLLAGRAVQVLGSADQPHSWTFVDDVARLLVTVAGDERAWGRAWHVPTEPPRTQREAVTDLCRVAGVTPVEVRVLHRPLVRLAGVVSPTIREVGEVLYQFTRPFVIDSGAAERTFGLRPTPWPDALAAVVAQYRRPSAAAPA
jgi:nucleoside-diphosphate-sugar epimerase